MKQSKWIIILIICALLIPIAANAESGTLGSLSWSLTNSYSTNPRRLTISGSGEIPSININRGNTEPWGEYSDEIKSIVIEDGVTAIGSGAFSYCNKVTSITIPASVTKIMDNVTYNCVSLTDVYYGGTQADWNGILFYDSGNGYLKNAMGSFH